MPPERPEDYELWEQTPIYVSMSYSQKFTSELLKFDVTQTSVSP